MNLPPCGSLAIGSCVPWDIELFVQDQVSWCQQEKCLGAPSINIHVDPVFLRLRNTAVLSNGQKIHSQSPGDPLYLELLLS